MQGFGELIEPANAKAIVVFVHGCGSGRHSQHDRFVANYLVEHGYGALLLDVLTPAEEARDVQTGEYRRNVELLAHRVLAASDKLANVYEPDLPIAFVGVGNGAAAALVAAARHRGYLATVISRGGQPHLAGPDLERVAVPTLLLAGGDDRSGINAARMAFGRLECERALKIVPGASHLFEEPGAMDWIALETVKWLDEHLPAAP